jgi:hypothetical protein
MGGEEFRSKGVWEFEKGMVEWLYGYMAEWLYG